MTSERMTKAEQMTLLMSLQRKMAEMKQRNEEVTRKNEEEILALKRENEEMKRKFFEGDRLLYRPISSVGRSPPLPTQKQLRRPRTRSSLKR